jgi:hypothetical protein
MFGGRHECRVAWDARRVAVSEVAGVILAAVERHGVLLVHDRALPSVTAIVAGGPVAGSWWSHPLANSIYNALTEVEDQVATVKLVSGKNTLVARRLWSDLAGVGLGRDGWQLDGLDRRTLAVLDQIDAAGEPVVLDRSDRRAVDSLERRLLAYPTELHTDNGNHVKAYQGWRHWCRARGITPSPDSGRARGAFERHAPTGTGRRLLPW